MALIRGVFPLFPFFLSLFGLVSLYSSANKKSMGVYLFVLLVVFERRNTPTLGSETKTKREKKKESAP